MRKLFLYIPIACLTILLTSFTWLPAGNEGSLAMSRVITAPLNNDSLANTFLYEDLQLAEKGLSKQAFDFACKGYLQLVKRNKISRQGYLTICDFSQSSRQRRLYLIDMINNKLVLNTYVAHGKNSGGEFATRFSNRPSSLQSSLGFYVTGNTYHGEHGLSLKVDGMEPGFNDKAFRRAIVIHGAKYVEDNWLEHCKTMGRSFGCPAVPKNESALIIQTIKNGTCLFIYHPEKKYLKGSKILNG